MARDGITERELRNALRNAIIFGALVYLAIRFISQIADIILIFSVTALIVIVLDSPVSWLARHKVPRQLSAAFIAVAVVALVVLVFYLVIPPASRQIQDLWKQVPALWESAKAWVEQFTRQHPTIAGIIPEKLSLEAESLKQYAPALLGGAGRLTASAAGAIISILLVFITTIYTLANPNPLARGFLRAVDPAYQERFESAAARMRTQIRAWAGGILIAMILIFLLTWIGLTLIGVEHAFLFALIAGLLEAVPIIGPILSAVPPVAFTVVSDPMLALLVVVLYVAIQQVESHLLVPLIMSRQLSLHPVTVIFSVLVMGALFGIVGIFLAAPAAVTAGILFDEFYVRGV